ncbi:hypothetical protein PENTCL1PPCAC_27641, partial [Pristionchus entomophagus]
VFLFLSVLSLGAAVVFQNSVVITSADVPVDVPLLLNLQSGTAYRVYATFAYGGDEEYAKNVKIYDYSGASLTVYGLDQPKPNNGKDYFLDNLRFLRAPIYVHDTNKEAAVRVPFTIYAVDANKIVSFPVVSARSAPSQVDSDNGFVAAGLTVLSAEQSFTMSAFDIGSVSSMVISSVGFDESDSKYNVMALNSGNSPHVSFLTVYGPITTLFNAKWGINARFQFAFSRNTKYDYQLSPGASFSLLSPGYLSATQSYQIPYTPTDALTSSFTFGANNYVQVWYQVRDVQAAENVNFQFATAENSQPTSIDIKNDQQSWQGQWANKVALNVQNTNGNHVPRFLFQITSGCSLSFSLLGMLLVSLFSRFY